MLEKILDLVKQQGQHSVVDNAEVPNEKNGAVMMEAASTITGGLQNMLSGGGLQSIIAMFSGKQGGGLLQNPVVAMMIGHLTNNLVKKLNLSPAAASGVANNIIPGVLENLIGKTRSSDPGDAGFNLNDLVAGFTGGQGAASSGGIDLQDILGKFLGGQAPQEADLNTANDTVRQKAQQNQQQGPGITDLLQSFFK